MIKVIELPRSDQMSLLTDFVSLQYLRPVFFKFSCTKTKSREACKSFLSILKNVLHF